MCASRSALKVELLQACKGIGLRDGWKHHAPESFCSILSSFQCVERVKAASTVRTARKRRQGCNVRNCPAQVSTSVHNGDAPVERTINIVKWAPALQKPSI